MNQSRRMAALLAVCSALAVADPAIGAGGSAAAQSPVVASFEETAAKAALKDRDQKWLASLVGPLRARVRIRDSASSALLLAWGRVELAAGVPDSALEAFVELTGRQDLPGRGLLEQARLVLTAQARTGVTLWYLGAEAADSLVWADYLEDLRSIGSPEELATLAALPAGAPRVAALRKFWDQRERADMRSPGERLLEHYKRLAFAREHYPRPDVPRRMLPGDTLRVPVFEFDDRGLIHVRHGEPTRIVRGERDGPSLNAVNGPPVPRNEIWYYASLGTDRIYVFRACGVLGSKGLSLEAGACAPPYDYRLVESVLDVFGYGVARGIASGAGDVNGRGGVALGNYAYRGTSALTPVSTSNFAAARIDASNVSSGFSDLNDTRWTQLSDRELTLLSIAGLSDRFAALFAGDRYTLPMYAADERAAGRADFIHGITTDSYENRFPVALESRIEVLSVGRADTSGLVHIGYAIKSDRLKAQPLKLGVAYPLRVRVQVRDSSGAELAFIDRTKLVKSARELEGNESLLGMETVTAPPGSATIRVVLEQNSLVGGATRELPLRVARVAAERFTGSDLVVGQSDLPLIWVREKGDTVHFNPAAAVTASGELEIYQELYGLAPGQAYQYELKLSRKNSGVVGSLFGGKATALTLSGTEKASGLVTPVHRALDISRLKPGIYTIEARFSIDGGGVVERTQRVEIRER